MPVNNMSANEMSLNQMVTKTLEDYFITLEGEQPNEVYKMVMGQVEKPLVEFILQQTDFNQTKAADILGMNRNTLRKKIQQYQITIE